MSHFDAFTLIKSVETDPHIHQRVLRTAGVGYGLILGLGYAIFSWGFDAWQLSSHSAALHWLKLVLGTPLVVILCMLVGGVAAWSNSTAISIILWIIGGWFIGALAGHIPFEGNNIAIWLLDRRLLGENIFTFGNTAAGRTMLLSILIAVFSILIGIIETFAIQWAWDRTTPEKKLGVGSWASLCLVCLPLTLVPTALTNAFINQPLRTHAVHVSNIINLALVEDETTLANNPDYRSVKPFRSFFSSQYQIHRVSFGSEPSTWESAYVDIVFDNHFVLRCTAINMNIIFCDNFAKRITGWADDLVHAGLTGERRWLDAEIRSFTVEDRVVAWLVSRDDQLSKTYEVSQSGQMGGWVFVNIRFSTDFEMTCRFRDAAPVRVDQCLETP